MYINIYNYNIYKCTCVCEYISIHGSQFGAQIQTSQLVLRTLTAKSTYLSELYACFPFLADVANSLMSNHFLIGLLRGGFQGEGGFPNVP